MTSAPARLLPALLLTLILAFGSVLSAAHMAPSADAIARAQSVLALEPGGGSLCAETGGEAHHCPFCHLLPRSPEPRPGAGVERLAFDLSAPLAGDLVTAERGGDPAHAPRAPPHRT